MSTPNEQLSPATEPVLPTPLADHTAEALAERAIERVIRSRSEFFDRAFAALSFNGISGDYAEFGCYGGTSMWLAWREIAANPVRRHMWAFDSFCGLPETRDPRDAHPAWIPNTMSMSVEAFQAVLARRGVPRDAYTPVEGYFEESLPRLGPDGPPSASSRPTVPSGTFSATCPSTGVGSPSWWRTHRGDGRAPMRRPCERRDRVAPDLPRDPRDRHLAGGVTHRRRAACTSGGAGRSPVARRRRPGRPGRGSPSRRCSGTAVGRTAAYRRSP